jgi:hypothetical protein
MHSQQQVGTETSLRVLACSIKSRDLAPFRVRQGKGIKVNLLVNYGWQWDLRRKHGRMRSVAGHLPYHSGGIARQLPRPWPARSRRFSALPPWQWPLRAAAVIALPAPSPGGASRWAAVSLDRSPQPVMASSAARPQAPATCLMSLACMMFLPTSRWRPLQAGKNHAAFAIGAGRRRTCQAPALPMFGTEGVSGWQSSLWTTS